MSLRTLTSTEVDHQLRELSRGVVDLHVSAELKQRIASGKPLRVKAGFDPTRPDLHLGHTVLLTKMRQFQDLGHTVIFLVGDYTAMVGDPTGRNKLRPQLELSEVQAAGATYVAQCLKVLSEERLEVRHNSEWLSKMTPLEMVKLMAKSTVSQIFERNDFSQRFAANKPIYQHELLYPLWQGFDSVALECDIELGGTDQLFNLMVGRDLMPQYNLPAQCVLTVPILEGLDAKLDENGHVVGDKMSKSAGNYIGISELPLEQVRKVMLVDDGVIGRYFELCSTRSSAEIADLTSQMATGRNPKEIKKLFAMEIVTRFHGELAAKSALSAWEAKFEADAIPDDVPEFQLSRPAAPDGTPSNGILLANALKEAGLVASTSEARRLQEQGGVELDQVKIKDPKYLLTQGSYLVRVGSKNRKFARLVIV